MERLRWWEYAACRGLDPMFDVDRGDYESESDTRDIENGTKGSRSGHTGQMKQVERICIRICRECPVIKECLQEALDDGIEHGIRGGMTARQRVELMSKLGVTPRSSRQTMRVTENGVMYND